MDMILDIVFFFAAIWFGVWLIKNAFANVTTTAIDEDQEISLYMEKDEQNGYTTYLTWREGNNDFVCQAPTEKELHTKLFEIYKGKPINMRVDEDTMLKISFEVFEKPVSQ